MSVRWCNLHFVKVGTRVDIYVSSVGLLRATREPQALRHCDHDV
jgi:hypothetical protein